jgi:putative hemolysin
MKNIATSMPSELLQEELDLLPGEMLLHRHQSLCTYLCPWQAIPRVMREIAIQREVTFRAVGEGTGAEMDCDEFDRHYLHLFLWDEAAGQIVGGYRIGVVGDIRAAAGDAGLYTSTLFGFAPDLLDELHEGIELGRSFVVPAYQGHPFVLSLLWKGIGSYVSKHPQHRLLFGPVSISNDYSHLSRSLMVQYLRQDRMHEPWRGKVKARTPFRSALEEIDAVVGRHEDWSSKCASIEAVNASVMEMEGKGIPVLLKHYLKLNARVLDFHVDADFGDALDVLIVTDLLDAPDQTVKRYLGAEGWENLRAYHQVSAEVCA